MRIFRISAALLAACSLTLTAAAAAQSVEKAPDPAAQAAFAAGQDAYDAENYQDARVLFREACDGGLPGGCFNLALMVDYGVGGAEDLAAAGDLYKKACDGLQAEGCHYLATRLKETDPPQLDAAFVFFEQACLLGHANGCLMAGYMAAEGEGTSQDKQLATSYLYKACAGGEQIACDALKAAQ